MIWDFWYLKTKIKLNKKMLFCFKSYACFGYVSNPGLMLVFHRCQVFAIIDEIHILNFQSLQGSLWIAWNLQLPTLSTIPLHNFSPPHTCRFGFSYCISWLLESNFLDITSSGKSRIEYLGVWISALMLNKVNGETYSKKKEGFWQDFIISLPSYFKAPISLFDI